MVFRGLTSIVASSYCFLTCAPLLADYRYLMKSGGRSQMRAATAILAVFLFGGACAVRKTQYVVVPWKEFQLNPSVALPLTDPGDRERLETFFKKDGNNRAAAPVN